MHLSLYVPTYHGAGIGGDLTPTFVYFPTPGKAPIIKIPSNPHLPQAALCRSTNDIDISARYASLYITHTLVLTMTTILRFSTNITTMLFIAKEKYFQYGCINV